MSNLSSSMPASEASVGMGRGVSPERWSTRIFSKVLSRRRVVRSIIVRSDARRSGDLRTLVAM
eukprot:2804253-Pleurochrysis_carterae.AAC.1